MSAIRTVALRALAIAAAATVVGFPLLSIEGDGPGARITPRALWFGLAVFVAALVVQALRRPREVLLLRIAGATSRLRGARVSRALPWALLALAVVFPHVVSRQHTNLAVETLIYMTLALGLNVIVGYGGVLVLGYAGFWAIGSYTFAILALRLGLSMWLALPLAGCAAMLAGVLLGLPALRLRGDYLAIVTLGFGEVVYYLLKTEVAITGGEMGLPNKDIRGSLQAHTSLFGSGPLVEPYAYYWPALALVVLAVVVIARLERSRIGRALVAMREDETAARCMGIDTTRLKLTAFAFAAMWAGLAGVIWTAKLDFTNPRYFDFMQSVIILAMVVLGGMGSIRGAMLGALLLYAGPALLRQYLPAIQEYRLLLFGALMVLLMIFRPQGLLGSSRLRVELAGEGDGT